LFKIITAGLDGFSACVSHHIGVDIADGCLKTRIGLSRVARNLDIALRINRGGKRISVGLPSSLCDGIRGIRHECLRRRRDVLGFDRRNCGVVGCSHINRVIELGGGGVRGGRIGCRGSF
jgi:hypothetical protein